MDGGAMIDAAELERARSADIVRVAERLGARLKRVGKEWCGPCPACGGTDRFAVKLGKHFWIWSCRNCPGKTNGRQAGGNVVDLVMHARDCGFAEAIEFIDGNQSEQSRAAPSPATQDNYDPSSSIRRYIAQLRPILGSPGEAYLRGDDRCIDTKAIADLLARTDAIGWHPAVYFNEPGHPLHKKRIGAIIGIFTNPITTKPTGAISRTYLSPDGKKIGKAKTLGTGGGIIRISADEDVEEGLHLAEGLESAFTAVALGLRPIWACGSSATLAKFPVLPGIECLTIFADHDVSGAGERDARKTEARWLEAGREAFIWRRESVGDLNDALREA
jgi:hypothetical protein